ncbi:MAG: hypothetical protein A2048_10975 [Deltaproteobacteria bacterium GWA2_45_12]|nr:MAG: hypothetical protein A2048_10975 [Deltaproteobacteria bacterium GWA2_45_12]
MKKIFLIILCFLFMMGCGGSGSSTSKDDGGNNEGAGGDGDLGETPPGSVETLEANWFCERTVTNNVCQGRQTDYLEDDEYEHEDNVVIIKFDHGSCSIAALEESYISGDTNWAVYTSGVCTRRESNHFSLHTEFYFEDHDQTDIGCAYTHSTDAEFFIDEDLESIHGTLVKKTFMDDIPGMHCSIAFPQYTDCIRYDDVTCARLHSPPPLELPAPGVPNPAVEGNWDCSVVLEESTCNLPYSMPIDLGVSLVDNVCDVSARNFYGWGWYWPEFLDAECIANASQIAGTISWMKPKDFSWECDADIGLSYMLEMTDNETLSGRIRTVSNGDKCIFERLGYHFDNEWCETLYQMQCLRAINPDHIRDNENDEPVNNDNNPEPEPDPVPPPNPPQLPFPLRTVPNLGDLFKDQNKIENPHQSPWEINR